MTATNHVVMGALIGTAIGNPWLAIPVAVASHFALDALPHFDYLQKDSWSLRSLVWLGADMALAASILVSLLLLQPANYTLLVACGIAAASPDLMWIYYRLYKQIRGHHGLPLIPRVHSRIQTHTSFRYWPIELSWLALTGGLLATRLI